MTSDEWRVEMKRLITSVNLTADDRRRIEEVWPEEADECRVVVGSGASAVGYLYDRANPTGGPLGNGLYGSATATPLVAGPDKT